MSATDAVQDAEVVAIAPEQKEEKVTSPVKSATTEDGEIKSKNGFSTAAAEKEKQKADEAEVLEDNNEESRDTLDTNDDDEDVVEDVDDEDDVEDEEGDEKVAAAAENGKAKGTKRAGVKETVQEVDEKSQDAPSTKKTRKEEANGEDKTAASEVESKAQ
jgi:hypothetical protein